MNKYIDIIKDYYKDIINLKDAKEEVKKNKFQDLLRQLFPSASKEIQDYTSGLETNVKISESGLIKNGSIDAFFGDLVIEFERNIPRDIDKGTMQIKEYCSALWNNQRIKRNYIGIVADGINWHVFYPTSLNYEKNLEYQDIQLKQKEKFYLSDNENSATDFFYFLNRLFFREHIITPTITNFKKDFGLDSILYEKIFENLKKVFDSIKNDSEISLSYIQWKKYLIYTYGSIEVSEELYLKHTYLCILARFIIWASLSIESDNEKSSLELIHKLINGKWFKEFGIMNLVEDDFFHWVTNDIVVTKLDKSWLSVLNQLQTYSFSTIKEDLLKGLYQELVDPENRHDLGEYYTPDWLCESICEYVFQKVFDKKTTGKFPKMLDPTCGSGSFLRAGIHQLFKSMKAKFGNNLILEKLLEVILNFVIGLDIHPLAVIIAKANYILAIKDIIKHKKKAQINIPVYLADSLFMPHSEEDDVLFGKNDITISFLDKKYIFPKEAISNTTVFDEMIFFVTEIAQNIANGEDEAKETFKNSIIRKFNLSDRYIIDTLTDSLFQLTNQLAEKIKTKKDTIWSFILRNNFRPLLFKNNFDIIIGNPPWLTYNYIKDIEYQKEIKRLSVDEYKLAPKKQKLMTQMELATIFLVHSCEKFLKNEKGILGFVMPRSIFNADQHENFRSEQINANCDVIEYWDMENVSPLFNIPSCVIFANRKKPILNKTYSSRVYSGKLPEKDIPLEKVESLISYKTGKLYQCKLGTRTSLYNKKIDLPNTYNYYKNKFFQGTTIVPRNFYFITQPNNFELKAKEFNAKTDEEQAKEGKEPWKSIFLSGIIETDFLFHTALSKNILPFFVTDLPYIILPVINENNGYYLKSADELKKKGYRGYPNWLKITESYWNKNNKDKSLNMNIYQRLDYQKTLSSQNPKSKYTILYNTSGKNISSAILEKQTLDKPFYADAKTYWFDTNSKEEAFYLCGILNSETVNELIKPFQSKGLLGERDIHTKVLEIPFPQFDNKDQTHKKISELSEKAYLTIKQSYEKREIEGGISNKRSITRKLVKNELKEITKLVEVLLGV